MTDSGVLNENFEHKEQTLRKRTKINADVNMVCATCNAPLLRPYQFKKEYHGSYDQMDLSISLNRHLILDQLPMFFCRECWFRILEPSFAEVVVTVKKKFMEHMKNTPEEYKKQIGEKIEKQDDKIKKHDEMKREETTIEDDVDIIDEEPDIEIEKEYIKKD